MLNAIKIIASMIIAIAPFYIYVQINAPLDLLRHYGDEEATGIVFILSILFCVSCHYVYYKSVVCKCCVLMWPISTCFSVCCCVYKFAYCLHAITGADDLFPYLIFAILKASPKQFHSNIRYVLITVSSYYMQYHWQVHLQISAQVTLDWRARILFDASGMSSSVGLAVSWGPLAAYLLMFW